MKVAYIASRYPHISHTFIRREIESLRAAGVEVETFTVRRTESRENLGPVDLEADDTTTSIIPASTGRLLWAHASAFLRHPAAYLATLRAAVTAPANGPKARLWRLFYFVEGMILWWECHRRGIRHVHAHFANVGADVARAAASYGRRQSRGRWSWSFTMHGYTEFTDVTSFDLARKTADADAVVCISDYTRSQLMMLTDSSVWERMSIVHCGIDTSAFSRGPERPDDGVLDVLFLGRVVVEKGILQLIEAVALVERSGVDIRLTVAGDGPMRARAEALAHELGVSDRITFVGAVVPEKVVEHYHRADVFCLPSYAEGVPVVLMEAMACELPVVTTYITGIPELVTEGVSGHMVTPGRADLLADALRDLADPQKRRSMGAAGRSVVESEFDIRAVGPQLVKVFEGLPGIARG